VERLLRRCDGSSNIYGRDILVRDEAQTLP
jgi:hypothetical protein